METAISRVLPYTLGVLTLIGIMAYAQNDHRLLGLCLTVAVAVALTIVILGD